MGLPKGNQAKRLREQQAIQLWNQVMKTPEGQKLIEEWRMNDTMLAMINICMYSMEWLEMKHRYKGKGLSNFFEFFMSRFEDLKDNDDYFIKATQYYKELGVDILERCGMELQGKYK